MSASLAKLSSIVRKLHLSMLLLGMFLAGIFLLKSLWDGGNYLYWKYHLFTPRDSYEVLVPNGTSDTWVWKPPIGDVVVSSGNDLVDKNKPKGPWDKYAASQNYLEDKNAIPHIGSRQSISDPNFLAILNTGALIWRYPKFAAYQEKSKNTFIFVGYLIGCCVLWQLLKLWCVWLLKFDKPGDTEE